MAGNTITPNPSMAKPSPFIRMYAMTETEVEKLVGVLKSRNILENLPKLFNDPKDYIISLQRFPFNIPEQHGSNLGNVLIGGSPIDTEIGTTDNFVRGVQVINTTTSIFNASVDVPTFYNDFRDYAPYTTISLYLPYVGTIELDASKVVGKELKITYIVSLYTGDASIVVSIDANPEDGSHPIILEQIESKIGTDVGFNAYNGGQVAGATLSLITSLATAKTSTDALTRGLDSVAGGAFKTAPTVSTTSESNNALYTPQKPLLYINRTVFAEQGTTVTQRARVIGKPSYRYTNLNDINGYTEVDSINITCDAETPATTPTPTNTELAEIESLLKSGVIL